MNPGKVTYKVTSLPEDPFLMKKASTTGGSQQYEGFVVDILDCIANLLNISYVLTMPADSRYGFYDASSGNWTGMIGELTRGEVDIAAAPLTVTRDRAKVVDFSQPFLEAGLRILIKRPQNWNIMEEMFVLLSPMRPEVWTVAILLIFAVAILLTIIGRFSPWEQPYVIGNLSGIGTYGMSLHNSLLFSFSSLMWQGFRVAPRSVSGRIISCFWWMFTLFFLMVYGANLTAFFLTKEPLFQSLPFATFDELAKQTDVQYGFLRNGATRAYFENSNLATDKNIYNNVKNNIDKLPTIYAEAIGRVRNGDEKYAFILKGSAAQYAAAQQPCDLMVVGEARSDRVYGFACRRNLDFCRQLDIAILHMKEKQELETLRKKWFERDCFSDLQHEYMYKGIPYLDKGEAPNMAQMKGVTLKRFGGPMLILLIGTFLSSLALVGEIIWSRRYGEVGSSTGGLTQRHTQTSRHRYRLTFPMTDSNGN
ncbi:hypothetical protein CHS0354_025820 [Potamilus streckersoni]|uniref:Glutamate receptor n=1 Tax=Potamilus streckersoni TaxID=2493646 RepID=A0AAE0T5F4_9BIVA|nr:hypothetical protein CHS0354_025820 [Potamilus streckersoni]